jgi:histidyl-tRNA synthetase
VLEAYFTARREYLSPLSQERLARGAVLRILDSKEPKDQPLLRDAPPITEFLSSTSSQRFAEIQRTLTCLKIPYVVVPHLVRGLDYYTETCFEIELLPRETHSSERLTILAGGRYDTLSVFLGHSEPIPAVGCVHTLCCCGGAEQ